VADIHIFMGKPAGVNKLEDLDVGEIILNAH
jgi:hypothetical protein